MYLIIWGRDKIYQLTINVSFSFFIVTMNICNNCIFCEEINDLLVDIVRTIIKMQDLSIQLNGRNVIGKINGIMLQLWFLIRKCLCRCLLRFNLANFLRR